MSRVRRAADSIEERLERSLDPGLERAHQARLSAASSISSRARPTFASGPTTATRTRSSRPRARREWSLARPRSWTNCRRSAARGRGGAHQPAHQAPGERRRGAAVHAVHELLGHDEPVAGGDDAARRARPRTRVTRSSAA